MITEELVTKRTNGGVGEQRTVQMVTLKDLESLCARVRKAGGKPATKVKVVRGKTGDIRLVAELGK